MICNFKNKLHSLGEYLLSENMTDEFLRLLKVSQDLAFGEMPDFSWLEKSRLFTNTASKFKDPKEWAERFLDLNSDKLINWNIVKMLGSGAYGEAYELDDGTVLKIFSGLGSLKEYKRLEDESFNPSEGQKQNLRVYNYGAFVAPDLPFMEDMGGTSYERDLKRRHTTDTDLGYAVIEKLLTPESMHNQDDMRKKDDAQHTYYGRDSLSSLMRVIADFSRNWIWDILEDNSNIPLSYSDESIEGYIIKNKFWPSFETYLNRPRGGKKYHSIAQLSEEGVEMYGMPNDWMETLVISNLKSLLRGHSDTKPENMGYRNRTPVFFDAHIDEQGVLPDDIRRVRDWDKDAQISILREYLGIKTGQLRQNLDYNEGNDVMLTPELAKQYGAEHLLPRKLDLGRYGDIFGDNTKIREFVDSAFYNGKGDRGFGAKQKWVDEFLDRNSEVLAQYDPVKYLGSGSYADAWETDDGRVIKIIRDSKDLSFYEEQRQALHSGSGSKENIMVYDMGVFDVPWAEEPYDVRKLSTMSWVVLERLVPIRDLVKDYESQLNELAKFLKDKDTEMNLGDDILYKFKKAFGKMRNTISKEVQSMDSVPPPVNNDQDSKRAYAKDIISWFATTESYLNDVKEVFKEIDKRVGFPNNWLENIIYAMINHLLQGDDDLHSGNIGFRGNQPVYFDPSNREPEYLNPKPTYSGPSSYQNTSEETRDYYDPKKTEQFDEKDETLDEEAASDNTNKTFDWEYQ